MIAEMIPEMDPCAEMELRGQVLICDDEPDICDALAHFVQQRGFEPIVTHLGCECVRLANQQQPTAILLDVNLPDVCGLDVCSQLTDSLQTREIPIIILSANGNDATIRQIRRSGASFYVRKPYDPNTVITILEQAIRNTDEW
ncbi:response regulator [bacterium]|nr:response regulator [bacterium]